jgi:PGF-pre-PGF domain-containing protein/methanogen extracellular protein (TIGR04279 family)
MVNFIRNIYWKSSIVLIILSIIFALPASAGINFNYSDGSHRNYTITDAALNSNNFVRLVNGDIEMPSITLEFTINKTLVSGSKSIVINTGSFGPKTTFLPNQKVYIASGGTATVSYMVDASNSFANTAVNVTTYKLVSNNVPFFSDFSIALLNFDDLKNAWSNNTKVMDDLINTASDVNKINESTVTLNATGVTGILSQNLAPGNYLILVTKGTNPKEIITSNVVKVMPFSSTIIVGDGSGGAGQGLDLNVSISLSGAPAGNYTYITSIINRSDYADNIGNINITWNSSGTLANSTTVNGIRLGLANSISDIIPRSNTSRMTTGSTSAILTLKTGSLPVGSYLVHTIVFNSNNSPVAFNQSLLTLEPATNAITTSIVAINGTGYVTADLIIPTPDANITLIIPNGTKATLSDGVTPISSITAISMPFLNSTLVNAASAMNLRFLGMNVTFLPAGAKFTPYILLRFNYSQHNVPPGVGEGRIDVYTYNGSTNSWEALVIDSKGTYPGGGKFIVVRVTHFSIFALMGIGPGGTGGGGKGGGGSSGGSGGGGGVVTSEPFDNIAMSESYDKDLVANIPVTYTFNAPELGVYEIAVTNNENENGITLRVEGLKGTSKQVTAQPPGTVYKNVNLIVGTQNMKEALVRFKVENSWLGSNSLAGSDVQLLHWDGSQWTQLDTTQTTSDNTYTYYEAKTVSLSPFAISGSQGGVLVPTATPVVEITSGVTPTVTPPVTVQPLGATTTVIYAIIVVVIIAIAAYFFVVKKKGDK